MGALFDTIGQIAAGQHGRVTYAQLRAAGADRNRITRWCADGRLRRVHREVYAVGHEAPSLNADLMAAVLACGEGAVASHRSAAHALRILRARPSRPEVTVPTTAGRARPGIRIHRVRSLPEDDTENVFGVPMTKAERVLLDLAPSLSLPALTRGCHEAWIWQRVSVVQVKACIARNPTKNGARKLLRAIGADATLSELEDGFLKLLRRHELALPRTNIDHAGDKVDCHWPDIGLTIELLSFTFHATRQAFESDVARRRRSNHTAYTWGDVFERGAQTAAELACQLNA